MSLSSKRIAFFDSGIGGLTVLKDCIKLLPEEDYIYFADTENVPYGIKLENVVKDYIIDAVDFLVKQDVKMIVIACNTATSVAISDLRARYNLFVVGMEPAVKPALEKNSGKKVLVLATSLTLKLEKLKRLLLIYDREHKVDKLALDGLVKFAERLEFDTDDVRLYLKEKFSQINPEKFGTVVLGCTHFLYFRDLIKGFFKENIQLIDGNDGTVRNIRKILTENSLLNKEGHSRIDFFASKKEDKRLSEVWNILLQRDF
ncbi:MAG: glutamate racemase [Brevinematia bacterium]